MNPAPAKPWRLGELADALQLDFDGDGTRTIAGGAPLDVAGPDHLAAVYDSRRSEEAARSRAGVLVVAPRDRAAFAGRDVIVAEAPKAAFARALALLYPEAPKTDGVHPSAVVDESAALGPGVFVGPTAVVGTGARLGAGVSIAAGAVIGPGVTIGDGTRVHARAVIYAGTEVGPRCEILAGAVVGAPGFGHATDERGRVVRVPHIGRVVLEEEVEVGANATIDRATFGVTRIGARTKIDNLVQIGHNVAIGRDVRLAAQSGLSGSVTVGDGVVMGGQSGVADHRSVGDGAAVAAKSAVFRDVEPGEAVAGIPALPIRTWRRVVAAQARLPRLLREWRTRFGAEGEDPQ